MAGEATFTSILLFKLFEIAVNAPPSKEMQFLVTRNGYHVISRRSLILLHFFLYLLG